MKAMDNTTVVSYIHKQGGNEQGETHSHYPVSSTVSFRLARNNIFCHNFVNTWNFCIKRVSFERTHGDLSQKFANLIKFQHSQKILAIFQFLMGATIH